MTILLNALSQSARFVCRVKSARGWKSLLRRAAVDAKTPDSVIAKHCNACHGTSACWAHRKSVMPPPGANAPRKKAALTACWRKQSPASMRCLRKAPAPIALTATEGRNPEDVRPEISVHLHQKAAFERFFCACDLCLRLFIAAKTRQARSNPNSWTVKGGSDGAAVFYRTAVDDVLARLPTHIHMGVPLGLGKPNHFVNALFQRIAQLPERQLTIYTALCLGRPSLGDGLQKRFPEPFIERVFGDYPNRISSRACTGTTCRPTSTFSNFSCSPAACSTANRPSRITSAATTATPLETSMPPV